MFIQGNVLTATSGGSGSHIEMSATVSSLEQDVS